MEFYFLGTGAGMPSKKRNVSSLAVIHPKMTWLFDCGEATQHQILHSPVRPRKVSAIFITHLHGDHIFGLPGFISTRSALEGTTKLTVYGPKGLKRWLETTFEVTGTRLRFHLEIIEIEDGMSFEQEGFTVHVKALEHRFPAFGYRVEAKEEKGALQVERLKEIGIPSGPLYRDIKEKEEFEWEGAVYKSSDFLGPAKTGKIFTVLGDTVPCDAGIELARGADVLVHEATFSDEEELHAYRFGHATARQAALVAKEAGVSHLLLNHVSARYVDREDVLLTEAREVFESTNLMADHTSYRIKG